MSREQWLEVPTALSCVPAWLRDLCLGGSVGLLATARGSFLLLGMATSSSCLILSFEALD